MNIKTSQVSRHIMIDRNERFALLSAMCGLGNEVLRERYSEKKGSWLCFMDSGIVLVWSANKKKLVTGFIPRKEQVAWIYRHQPNKTILKLIEQAQKKYEKGMAKI